MTEISHPSVPVEIGLAAAIVAVRGDAPLILVARGGQETGGGSRAALPFISRK